MLLASQINAGTITQEEANFKFEDIKSEILRKSNNNGRTTLSLPQRY